MKIEADSILMDVRDITGTVQESIINLENYGSNDQHTKLPVALKEATMYLNDIKHRSRNIPKAEDTMKCANDQHDIWSEELAAATEQKKKIDNYLKSRKAFNDRLDDLHNLSHRAFRDSLETEGFLTKNNKNIDKLGEKKDRLSDDKEELEKLVEIGIIAQSDSLMETLHDSISKLKIDNKDLVDLNIEIEDKITERESELDGIKETLIPDAQKHAEDLSRRSKIIVGLFQNSKDGAQVAMLAGTAHKNITDAINSARIAADKAHEAAVFSNDKLNPIDADEETLIEKGLDLSLESEAIQTDAINQISKIKGKIKVYIASLYLEINFLSRVT
jgi:laminin, alpha 1/2